MSKRVADLQVETLEVAGVRSCYGIECHGDGRNHAGAGRRRRLRRDKGRLSKRQCRAQCPGHVVKILGAENHDEN